MHATQPQGGACPEPHQTLDGASQNLLAGLLTNPACFGFWLSDAVAGQVPPNPEDGYAVTDAGLAALTESEAEDVPATEAPGTAARVLRSAALYLERYGWIQGSYYDGTSAMFTPPACLVGAIGVACYGGLVDAPAQHFDDPGFLDFEEALLHLDRYLLVEDSSESYEFNDVRGRTVDQVTEMLRNAAARPAD